MNVVIVSLLIRCFPGIRALDGTGPAEAVANRWLPEDCRYRLDVGAPRAGLVRASSGLFLVADRALADLAEPLDTLLGAGGHGAFATLAQADG